MQHSIASLVLDQTDDEFPVSPAPFLGRLTAFLAVHGYTPHAIGIITKYADQIGSLEGLEELGYLDPADRADADAILEASWPAVPFTSPAWDADRVAGLPARWTAANPFIGGKLVPPELDEDDSNLDRLPAA